MSDTAPSPRQVNPIEAERLVGEGRVRVVDVRSPHEYWERGHITGAFLLPVDLIASAPAVLARDDTPLLLVCEHGVRSAHAAAVLARAGFEQVLNMAGGMSCWGGPRDHTPAGPETLLGPSAWLLSCGDLLPARGEVLDVACGRGRHALLLASVGLQVRAVDSDAGKIREVNATAKRLGLPVQAEHLDLETPGADFAEAAYDLVVGIHYLHRPLFPALLRAVRPGGLLIWETFTVEQASRGKPTNPDFLLRPGELRTLVAPLEILREREGDHEGRFISSVAARRAASAAE